MLCVCACVCARARVCVCVCVHRCVYVLFRTVNTKISSMCFTYTVLVACNSHPCTHRGVCTVTSNGYKCTCKNHHYGRNCEREFYLYCWNV